MHRVISANNSEGLIRPFVKGMALHQRTDKVEYEHSAEFSVFYLSWFYLSHPTSTKETRQKAERDGVRDGVYAYLQVCVGVCVI